MENPPVAQPRPGLPEPLPTVPRKALWICLLIPTGVTVVAFLVQGITVLIHGNSLDLATVIILSYGTLLSGSVAALFTLPWFVRILRKRYRGKSLVLLSLGYLLGQVVIQLPLGYGACFGVLMIGERL